MPRTFNGIGTKYYGASDRQPDGSFVTTEWFTLFAPVIPLRSMRVHYLGKSGSSELYNVAGQSGLDMKRVLQIYGLHVATWIVVFLPLFLPGLVAETAATVSTIFMVAAMPFWLWVVPGVLHKAK